MRLCVVVDCEQFGVNVVPKATSWGVWEYWVCDDHKGQVDDGAFIQDHPDGFSITLHPPHEHDQNRFTGRSAADIDLPLSNGSLTDPADDRPDDTVAPTKST